MTYNPMSLIRHQNAAKRAFFTNQNSSDRKAKVTAEFAPLWQAAALAGGGLGAIKGGLDQNPDGSQIDPASRLLNVGMNAGVGATLAGAAGAGIPQLLNENPTARNLAQSVYRNTGITPDSGQVPVSTADRIREERRLNRLQGKTIGQRVQRLVDPITGRLEVLGEDLKNLGDVVSKPFQPSEEVLAKREAVKKRKEAMNAAIEESIRQTELAILDSEIKKSLQNPTPKLEARRAKAVQRAQKQAAEVLDDRTVAQKAVDGVVGGTVQAGRKTKELTGKAVDAGKSAIIKASPLIGRVRTALGFSYMDNTSNFAANPYTKGATIGAVLGTGIGAGIGLTQGVNNAYQQDQSMLDQIQAIPDPYVRKKEWDLYNNPMSQTGRGIANTTQAIGSGVMGAGAGVIGGGLLGGAGLTAYHNIRNKKFNGFGQPTPGRLEGLKIFLTGRR